MAALEVTLVIVILVLVAIWAILDISRTKFLALLALVLVVSAISWAGGFSFLPMAGLWLTSGRHILELVFALLAAGLVTFWLRRAWNNRNLGSLDLGSGLDQKEFERRCAGFLELHGWTLASRTTVAGMMITRATKADARLALMFVGAHGDFGELAHAVKTDRLGDFGRLVFVCYLTPLVSHPANTEQDWLAVHYPALADLEALAGGGEIRR